MSCKERSERTLSRWQLLLSARPNLSYPIELSPGQLQMASGRCKMKSIRVVFCFQLFYSGWSKTNISFHRSIDQYDRAWNEKIYFYEVRINGVQNVFYDFSVRLTAKLTN